MCMDHKCKSLAELNFRAHSNCNGHGVWTCFELKSFSVKKIKLLGGNDNLQ